MDAMYEFVTNDDPLLNSEPQGINGSGIRFISTYG